MVNGERICNTKEEEWLEKKTCITLTFFLNKGSGDDNIENPYYKVLKTKYGEKMSRER